MDISPHAGAARRRGPTGQSANDAVWWVVLYQGALDYTRSIGAAEQDVDAATRLVDPYRRSADRRRGGTSAVS